MKNGLQKELFLESMNLIHEPGWGLLEEGDLLAFKSPVPFPFMNIVYGSVSLVAYQKVKNFYQNKPFFWLLPKDQKADLLLERGFKGPDLTFEMELNLAEYQYPGASTSLEVRKVHSSADHLKWVDVAAGWLNVDPSFVDQFFSAWIKTGRYIPYLGFCEGQPAATSLVYCGKLGAALYFLGTLPPFRNRGLGTAVTHACLKTAKEKNIDLAVLYASKMGKPVYEKIGFQLTQTIREYSYSMESHGKK